MSSMGMTDILDDISKAEVRILMLRKPTPIKKIIDRIPRPEQAIPPNGLPQWYRLGLECKLPVPEIPEGKITFSRGLLGENLRKDPDDFKPAFDLTDPYCNNVTYEYEAIHDPHLTKYFAQPIAHARMGQLGFMNQEGYAVCSLKQFNTFRKYLYNRFMDRVHVEMVKEETIARENITLLTVERDVFRRKLAFRRAERAREHMEAAAAANASDEAEKKRLAKEKEAKAAAHVEYMNQLKERRRLEGVARGKEKSERIAARVKAAAEIELRRKITMIRQWRQNEKKRQLRLMREAQQKRFAKEQKANNKWRTRIDKQNNKITEDMTLLRVYTEDMEAAVARRNRRSMIGAYNRDLQLQNIKLANLKKSHQMGRTGLLVNTIAAMFQKTQRGQKAVTPAESRRMARRAVRDATSEPGSDKVVWLGQARSRLEESNLIPPGVSCILEEVIITSITIFLECRVENVMRKIDGDVYRQAFQLVNPCLRRERRTRGRQLTRGQHKALVSELAKSAAMLGPWVQKETAIGFGDTRYISNDTEFEGELKSVKNRPPTPIPSAMDLLELVFGERKEDLLPPVVLGSNMPERRKLVGFLNQMEKTVCKVVTCKVMDGIDVATKKITQPKGYRPHLDWNDTVRDLTASVLTEHVHKDDAEMRRGIDYLTRRILLRLSEETKRIKLEQKKLHLQQAKAGEASNTQDGVLAGH